MGQPVTHWQIITRQPDKAQKFYSELFGWEIDADNALGYRMVDTESERGINGGIWPAPPEAHDFVQLFIEVEDVPAMVKRVGEMGGKVIIPPQKLPDGDELAILHDCCGIPFGLKKTRAD